MTNGEPVAQGDSQGSEAPKGRRFLSALVDLLVIPIVLGIVAGLILLAAPEAVRNVVLILINIVWLLFRDAVFSPGRKMAGVVLKGLDGRKVTWGQAFIRNILLIVPFVLVVGYIVETIFILAKGNRLADRWAKTHIVTA